MTIDIATAGGGHTWETSLVAAAAGGASPIEVVRRCADMADVLAIASTGRIRVVAVAADLRRLDSETVFELAGFGVAVVALHRAGDQRTVTALGRIGVDAFIADDAGADEIVRVIAEAAARADGADGGSGAPDDALLGSDPSRAWRTAGRGEHAGPAPFVPSITGVGPASAPGAGHGRPGDEDAGGDGGEAGRADVSADSRRRGPGGLGIARNVGAAHRKAEGRRGRRWFSRRSAAGAGARGAPDAGTSRRSARGDVGSGDAARGDAGPQDRVSRAAAASRPGRVIAVWGPVGAPGRSTVAMGLADRAAAAGIRSLLVDADVYGGVLASAFGLLDESAGLAGACRLAATGRLDPAEFASLCWRVRDRLTLLTGIARADRWPEVRPSALPAVLDLARSAADLVVVDCAAVVESDEEITFDTLAPRRNGATIAALRSADAVLAVGSADPVGVERLARGYADLGAVIDGDRPAIVFNRVRPSAASRAELRQAARRFCDSEPIAYLPEDRGLTDLAWRRGWALGETRPGAPLVTAFDELLGGVVRAEARVAAR